MDQPTERYVIREEIQSAAAIPLRTGNEIVGLMFANYRMPQTFTPPRKELIELFANQVAIAIHNSRLFKNLERRVEALTALNEVGQTLTSGLRLQEDEILELIYEQVCKLTGTQDMYIALYDEATQMLRFGLALEKGQRVKIAEPRQANMERRGKTEEIIFFKRSLLHKTMQESEGWYKIPGHQEFIGRISPSWMGVSMIVGEKVLGVIAIVDWEREYAYDELDLQVVSSMASQAAIALDNANLYARRIRDLDALREVGQILTSGSRLTQESRLTEDEILELIYEQAQKLTGTQNIYIALYDSSTEMIRFGLAMEEGQEITIEPRQADVKRLGRTEEVIFTRQPLLHRTAQESTEWYNLPGHQKFRDPTAISWLGVPMIVGEKVLGMIAIYDWERENAYDEMDLQVLSSMASQAAIALDNAKLYQMLERRIAQVQTVQEITNAIKTYAELFDLLQSILDVSLPRLQAKVGTIDLLDPATNELVTQAVVGTVEQGQSTRISIGRGITGQAAREERAIYVADTSQDERFLDYLGPMRSELAIPLHMEGAVIGVFNIEDPEPDAFDEETRELAELIAGQVAIIIQNTQRREELIANRQLAALGIATAAFQHRINNTLNIISPNISRLRRRVNVEDETIREILDIIERNTKYTADYINRIQEPLKEEEIQRVDINATLREAQGLVWGQYQGKAEFGTVEPRYNTDESLPPIEASLGQITEVFRNLIENGYKAMGASGGTLTIVSRQVDGWLEVEIQDTGPGVPPEIRDRLFVKPVPSKQPGQGGQGSGLGLWLSALLLQKYAGKINIAGTGPQGTTVLVRLPVSKSNSQ
jgi:GAF domain-containing protein